MAKLEYSKEQYAERLAGHLFARTTIPAFPPKANHHVIVHRDKYGVDEMPHLQPSRLVGASSWNLTPHDIEYLYNQGIDPSVAADGIISGKQPLSPARYHSNGKSRKPTR